MDPRICRLRPVSPARQARGNWSSLSQGRKVTWEAATRRSGALADRISEAGLRDHEVCSMRDVSGQDTMHANALLPSTLFWAGKTFAPHHVVEDITSPARERKNIQDFLQERYIAMYQKVVSAVGDVEGVLGFEVSRSRRLPVWTWLTLDYSS